MNTDNNGDKLDELISGTIGRERPQFDFNKWKDEHRTEIQTYESQTAGESISRSPLPINTWREIMKRNANKIAAAAVLLLAILTGMYFLFSSTENLAFADVVRPILIARTVTFKVIMAGGGNVPTKVMSMGTQRFRSEVLSPDGKTVQVIVIADYETSRMLQLIPSRKRAVLIEMKDLPEKPENILEEMRNIITDLQNNPDFSVEPLGEMEIDGRIAIGFRATAPDEELAVWVDPQTELPIRTEQKWHQVQFTCTDFQFDVPMDESLFSMEIPEGYSSLPTGEVSIGGSNEQNLIEGLRIYAELILDNVFPTEFIGKEYLDDVKKNLDKFANMTDKQRLDLALELQRGYIFVQLLKDENDWNYVGGGVKFGDGESPVCWYRPDGSGTYRVIYGDLSVKDVAPENLPK